MDQEGNPLIENAGFAWAAHYAEAEFLLAARRNARDFEPWAANDGKREGAVKDMLSGKEEVIGSENWQEDLANINGYFFRQGERLGAINLIKRVWHAAYLQPRGLKRTPRFDSLPAVAASSFDLHLTEAARERESAWRLLPPPPRAHHRERPPHDGREAR